jgi:hypothetical protein
MISTASTLAALAVILSVSPATNALPEPASMSVHELLQHPSEMIGKKVSVVGYVDLGKLPDIFRNRAIYESKSALAERAHRYRHGLGMNPGDCLSIANPEKLDAYRGQYHHKVVALAGTLLSGAGVLGSCSAPFDFEIE